MSRSPEDEDGKDARWKDEEIPDMTMLGKPGARMRRTLEGRMIILSSERMKKMQDVRSQLIRTRGKNVKNSI